MSNSTVNSQSNSGSSTPFGAGSSTQSSSGPSSSNSASSSASFSSSASSSQPTSSSATPTFSSSSAPTSTYSSNTVPSTSVIVTTPSSNSVALAPTTITLTSTSAAPAPTSDTSSHSSPSSSATGAASLATSGASPSGHSGISSGGKIAVAVVVPVVAVAVIVFALLFLWRRRKQRKDAEELRRKEVEEYGYNPNTDPTVPNVGVVGGNGDEQMTEAGGAGYRGWGATPMVRKPSTTLSSGNGIGMAMSDATAVGTTSASPTHGAGSEAHSGDPLLNSPNRPPTADSEKIGALGVAPTAGANRNDIHRGASNASSSYSAGNRSEGSGEAPVPGAPPANYYANDGAYEEGGYGQSGPYAEKSYGGGQPVIQNVQARRNTRIENPSVLPQQGNAGIAQNF